MSFSTTALQLVNRTRRKRRQGDTQTISEIDDLAALDAVNTAMNEVLSSRQWEFDVRQTQFVTKGRKTGVEVFLNEGASLIPISLDGLESEDVSGDFIVRCVPNGSTEYGDTAIRSLYSTIPLSGISYLNIPFTLAATETVTAGELFYSEYMLPETVKSVLRVTHQEETLTLDQVGASIEFDELYPRKQIEYDRPRVVSVGGLDLSTYLVTDDAPMPRLRAIVWPVPDDDYILDYQYVYRHPALTTGTDTLDGVPPEVEDLIVNLATADMQANFDRRVEEARAMRRDSMIVMDEIHKRHGGQVADRAIIGNWDSPIGGRNWRNTSRGRLIGGG
jgi:hypothetical protein